MINSYNNWYEDIWYMHKKTIYSHIFPSTYDVRVQMLLHKWVLVHIRNDNKDMILLAYLLDFYYKFFMKGMTNICGCKYTLYTIWYPVSIYAIYTM